MLRHYPLKRGELEAIASPARLPQAFSSPVTSHQSLLRLCRGSRLGRAIPLVGAAQSFFEYDLRFVAEQFLRLSDISLGIANVSIARRLVLRLKRLAANFSKHANDLIQGHASTHAYIENF